MDEQAFPLRSVDAMGCSLAVRSHVRILSVASCVTELPVDDQDRLASLVGEIREILRIDSHGFVWLSFDATGASDGFCLLPGEVVAVPLKEAKSNPTFQRTASPPLN